MKIEIIAPEVAATAQEVKIRVVLFNDSYEPVEISRNAFIGPTVQAVNPPGSPHPEGVEATFGGPEEPLMLQSFCFYGRERTFNSTTPGEFQVTARYCHGNKHDLSAVKRLLVKPA